MEGILRVLGRCFLQRERESRGEGLVESFDLFLLFLLSSRFSLFTHPASGQRFSVSCLVYIRVWGLNFNNQYGFFLSLAKCKG